mgnify:CR=1 FL=1
MVGGIHCARRVSNPSRVEIPVQATHRKEKRIQSETSNLFCVAQKDKHTMYHVPCGSTTMIGGMVTMRWIG